MDDFRDHLLIICEGYSCDLQMIQEDLKTLAHNVLTRMTIAPGHALNVKHWGTAAAAASSLITGPIGVIPFIYYAMQNQFNSTDKIDKAYFDHHWSISKSLQEKLKKIIQSKYKNAFLIKSNADANINRQFFDKGNYEREHYYKRPAFGTASRHVRQATRGVGNGMFTTATCFYKLHTGHGHYILYFTFDSDSIEDCKILCLKPGQSPYQYDSYYVQDITEWKSVNKSEYSK